MPFSIVVCEKWFLLLYITEQANYEVDTVSRPKIYQKPVPPFQLIYF